MIVKATTELFRIPTDVEAETDLKLLNSKVRLLCAEITCEITCET